MKYISQNKLNKVCFQLDNAYRNFKDLPRRAASDKVLRDKAFNINAELLQLRIIVLKKYFWC